MVLVATRSASTSARPTHDRFTARTILFTSTGSLDPFRFVTRIVVCGGEASAASRCAVQSGARPLVRFSIVSVSMVFLLVVVGGERHQVRSPWTARKKNA